MSRSCWFQHMPFIHVFEKRLYNFQATLMNVKWWNYHTITKGLLWLIKTKMKLKLKPLTNIFVT